MGRRKFYMYNKQHGRNMIISEYIWRRWLATQPNPERIRKVLDESLPDKDPNKFHRMYRKRKQVSSHIQVQKGFFKFHWACELFFPPYSSYFQRGPFPIIHLCCRSFRAAI